MYGVDGPDTFWLDFTNIALGLVTLLCVLVIAGGVVRELLVRWEHRAAVAGDDHAFATPRLGVTMADGGERVDREESEPRQDKS
jgi:hypothetical protein